MNRNLNATLVDRVLKIATEYNSKLSQNWSLLKKQDYHTKEDHPEKRKICFTIGKNGRVNACIPKHLMGFMAQQLVSVSRAVWLYMEKACIKITLALSERISQNELYFFIS